MNGLALDVPGVRILDTRELDWQPHPYVGDTMMKPLSVDGGGESFMTMLDYPPADPRASEKPHRIYHATAREFIYVLSGQMFPHWDYDPDQRVVLKAGFYMDREPRTPHGSDSGASPVRCQVLAWHITSGGFLSDAQAAAMLGDPPPGPAAPEAIPAEALVLDRPGVRMLDTRALDWEPRPGVPGALHKPLSRDADGAPVIFLCRYPAGRSAPPELRNRPANGYRELVYVLDGDLRGDDLVLREGFYLDRSGGAIPGFESGEADSNGGCTLLVVRSADAVFMGEESFGRDTIEGAP